MKKLGALLVMLLLVLVVGYLATSVAKADDKPVYHLTVENQNGDSMYMVCTLMPVPAPMKQGVQYR